jgi:hypothetical protein
MPQRRSHEMSLIEHLDREDWEEFLRNTFAYSLELLKTDPFRYAGSAVDDMKSWLSVGGVSRVKHHLNHQMDQCQYSTERKLLIIDLLDQIVQEHRLEIVDLMARNIILAEPQEFLFTLGFVELEIEDLLR